jgi:hypothetical protein
MVSYLDKFIQRFMPFGEREICWSKCDRRGPMCSKFRQTRGNLLQVFGPDQTSAEDSRAYL